MLSFTALALVACAAEGEEPAGLDATPTAEATDDAPTEDPEAAVLAAYTEYWDAYVAAVSEPDADPAPFEGIALPETIEQEIHFVEGYVDNGISRTGEPVVSDVQVQLDGDTALVLTCVDESEWIVQQGGEPVPHPPELQAPHPLVFEVRDVDGTWLVGPTVDPEGLIEC